MSKVNNSPNIQLNPVQLEAVKATEGPVLVLAGAGSGKTRVLTSRIAYLVQEKKIDPYQILAVTFTKKAAQEMMDRVQKTVGRSNGFWIGTFHSIFAKILRWDAQAIGYSPNYVIYDKEDQERLLKNIMEEMHLSPKMYATQAVSSAISKAKNGLVSPDAFLGQVRNPFEEVVAKIYPKYEKQLRFNQACDFDDLITLPIKLFTTRPEVLKKYQSRFQYILVDEYQDTNRAQYQLLHELAKNHQNIFVVGDDDQSIYSWRGADIRNILEFEKDFPAAQVFRLEQNYRSTKNILKAANSVIENNESRKGKTLWSDGEDGDKVHVLEVYDGQEEAQKIFEKIKNEVFKNKRTFRDFAILYRTNAQSRLLEDSLRRSGISYVIVGGVRFYERKEVKDVLAYLKVITNPNDAVSLQRVINFPTRGIGERTIEKLRIWAHQNQKSLFEAAKYVNEVDSIAPRTKKTIQHFHEMILKYIDLKDKISLSEWVYTLVDEIGFLKMYKEDGTVESQNRADNIRELLAAIPDYCKRVEEPTLASFLEEVALITEIDSWNESANAVTLMTVHSAKGLEFPVVFITGLEHGLFPIMRSMNDDHALEEERRLFYVGMTRAEKKLYILWAKRRQLYNEISSRLPSPFLDELDKKVTHITSSYHSDFAPKSFESKPKTKGMQFDSHPDYESFSQEVTTLEKGSWVQHEIFGKGEVIKIEGRGQKQKITVRFEGNVVKKFLSQYARFNIL